MLLSQDQGHATAGHALSVSEEFVRSNSSTCDLDDLLEGTGRIILAEDDSGVRKSTVLLLEDLGYQVDAYASGPDTLVALAKDVHPVQLLLTDFNMPGFTGYELARRVRMLRPTARVLLTSGSPEESIVPATKPADWPPFIAKPFTCRTLGSKLREILHGPPATL